MTDIDKELDGIGRTQIRNAARNLLNRWGDGLTKPVVATALLLAPDTAGLSPRSKDKLTDRIWRRVRKETNA